MDDRDDRRRSGRIFRTAIVGSLLVHALAFFLYGVASLRLAHLRFGLAHPTPPPNAVVSISNSIKIEKRAKLRPQPRSHAAAPRPRQQQPRPRRFASVPQPVPVPLAVPKPLAEPQTRALHELSKTLPSAAPNPPRTIKATAQPKPVPSPAPTTGAPQRVALAQRPTQSQRQSQLTQAQIAQMNEAFNKTLAELRRESDPLRVKPDEVAGPKRYRMQMNGINSDLRHGQGYYYPLKEWSSADGYNYYYVTYEFTWADGTLEHGSVPWPIRFRPREDPFANPGNSGLEHVPLPPPLPGWKLPPGERVGKALRDYFPALQGSDQQQPSQQP